MSALFTYARTTSRHDLRHPLRPATCTRSALHRIRGWRCRPGRSQTARTPGRVGRTNTRRMQPPRNYLRCSSHIPGRQKRRTPPEKPPQWGEKVPDLFTEKNNNMYLIFRDSNRDVICEKTKDSPLIATIVRHYLGNIHFYVVEIDLRGDIETCNLYEKVSDEKVRRVSTCGGAVAWAIYQKLAQEFQEINFHFRKQQDGAREDCNRENTQPICTNTLFSQDGAGE